MSRIELTPAELRQLDAEAHCSAQAGLREAEAAYYDQVAEQTPDHEERINVLETTRQTDRYAQHINHLQRQIEELRAELRQHIAERSHTATLTTLIEKLREDLEQHISERPHTVSPSTLDDAPMAPFDLG